jgi:hypothetical protein
MLRDITKILHIFGLKATCQSTDNKTVTLKDNYIPMPKYENHPLHKTNIHISSRGTMNFKGVVVPL